MADHVRWGILGAANFARKTMGPALSAARRGTVSALATRNAKKAVDFTELFPGLRVHDSYEALLADPAIDAIYIPLPNALHVHWTVAAAEAGKAVLCEKPIAMEEGEFDSLIAARKSTGKLIAEGYMPVHHPQWHAVRDLIAEGRIGALHTVTCAFTFGLDDTANVRLDPELGGGALRDIGVYPIGTFRFATGLEPEPTHAEIVWREGVDSSVWVDARAGEVRFRFHLSFDTTPRQEMVFEGSEGWMSLTAPFNAGSYGEATIHLHVSGRPKETIRFPTAEQYVNQVEAFNAALLDGAAYPCPLEFSRGTQAVIDAIFAKA